MTTRSWNRRLFARTPRTVRKAPARPRGGFFVEPLEDRVVPAVPNTYLDFLKSTPATVLISGIDSALDKVQSAVDSVTNGLDVPVIGDQIRTALRPLDDDIASARAKVRDAVTDFYANTLRLNPNANALDLFQNTLFTVNNASATAILAHVTIWSDLAVPVFAFNVYLTGYDAQPFDLRQVLLGTVPTTASAGQDPQDTRSPKGILSQDINFASCTGQLPPPSAAPIYPPYLRAALTGGPSTWELVSVESVVSSGLVPAASLPPAVAAR